MLVLRRFGLNRFHCTRVRLPTCEFDADLKSKMTITDQEFALSIDRCKSVYRYRPLRASGFHFLSSLVRYLYWCTSKNVNLRIFLFILTGRKKKTKRRLTRKENNQKTRKEKSRRKRKKKLQDQEEEEFYRRRKNMSQVKGTSDNSDISNIFLSILFWGLELWCLTPLSTIFQLYRGGGNWRKPPTCRKSLTNCMLYRVHLAWAGFEHTTLEWYILF